MGKYEIAQFREIVLNSETIVFFGGAGVSTPSGIPDFRGSGGLNSSGSEIGFETILSHDYFARHTDDFYRFYKQNMCYPDAQPNAVHLALAELERIGKLNAVITQNIDGLHQLAGSKNVIELHGSIHRNLCTRCGRQYDLKYVLDADGVPRCQACGAVIKPDVVLYGEALNGDAIYEAESAIYEADTMIIAGTSLNVYPATALAMEFRGETLVVVNRTPTRADGMATLVLRDELDEVFESLNL